MHVCAHICVHDSGVCVCMRMCMCVHMGTCVCVCLCAHTHVAVSKRQARKEWKANPVLP